jgi:hypothetical protein
MGSTLVIAPPANCAGSYRYFYVPRWTNLVNDTDLVPDALTIGGWHEYIVVDMAIKCLAKEESDTTVLEGRKLALLRRIESESANRDASEQDFVVDPGFSSFGGWTR